MQTILKKYNKSIQKESMKISLRLVFFYCIFFVCLSIAHVAPFTPPKLTVVLVIDQCAYYYLQALKQKFRHGLKRMLNHSFVYANAHFPHAKPETAIGHAALNTGSYAFYHGFIANKWPDRQKDTLIDCDQDDNIAESSVFGSSSRGKSAHFLETDGISDRFIFKTSEEDPYRVFSIALKSRAAIAMAGHVKEPWGGVFWFENNRFTSSKAFTQALPGWIATFNASLCIDPEKTITWIPCYNPDSAAYALVKKNSYLFSQETQFFNRVKQLDDFSHHKKHSSFWYQASPNAIYDMFDLAKECLKAHVIKQPGHTLLWLGFSGLDKLGHVFGPDSYETIDYMYHFDRAVEDFITFLKAQLGKKHFVLILTADHGVSSLPEINAQMGLPTKRILTTDIERYLQENIAEKFDISEKIISCDPPCIYLNHQFLNTLSIEKQNLVTKTIFEILQNMPEIKCVWHVPQLMAQPQNEDSISDHFRQQIYKGRTGDFLFQVAPLYTFTSYKKGANHGSPYNQDTHVPLIFYGPKYFRSRYVYDYVNMLQFVPTLSFMLGLELPSTAVKQPLPHFFSKDPLFDSF
jgi:hypothetical protein